MNNTGEQDRIPLFSEEVASATSSEESFVEKGMGDLAKEVVPLLVFGAIVAVVVVGAVFLFLAYKFCRNSSL